MATIAVQMDPIGGINIKGDCTFALLLEAARRGHTLFHTTPERLSFRAGKVTSRFEPLTVRDEAGNHANLGTQEQMPLSDMDVVLLRQDPPFDMAYVTSTHLLEIADTLVVNDPAGVRNAPEKLFVLEFSDLMPETLISRDRETIKQFRADVGDIVIKPLYGNGGAAVFKLSVGRSEPLLADGHVRHPVPRARRGSALPAARDGGRQADHPDRRRVRRRRSTACRPRARSAPTWCAAGQPTPPS